MTTRNLCHIQILENPPRYLRDYRADIFWRLVIPFAISLKHLMLICYVIDISLNHLSFFRVMPAPSLALLWVAILLFKCTQLMTSGPFRAWRLACCSFLRTTSNATPVEALSCLIIRESFTFMPVL